MHTDGQAPIALYLHIPFCKSKCAYCDFASYAGREEAMARYCSFLVQELADTGAACGAPPVGSVFLGGGTPTLLSGAQVAALLAAARAAFRVLPGAEMTMEGNPGTLTLEALSACRAAGINRLSLGAQAAQGALLAALGRIHRWADVAEGVAMARAAGFENLNLDLMFGLPGQTMADWLETLAAAVALAPAHISCYGLQGEEGTPLALRLAAGEGAPLPDEDAERAQYDAALRVLAQAGYAQYELSNFARPGAACRQNLTYWTCGEYLGVGCAAHSHWAGERWGNTATLDDYMAAMAAHRSPVAERTTVTEADARFERMMLGLRLTRGVEVAAFARRFGCTPQQVWGDVLDGLVRQGLLAEADGYLRLTRRGMDVQNTVLTALL